MIADIGTRKETSIKDMGWKKTIKFPIERIQSNRRIEFVKYVEVKKAHKCPSPKYI